MKLLKSIGAVFAGMLVVVILSTGTAITSLPCVWLGGELRLRNK